MKPHILALLTALAWGIGGYCEKKGLHLGNLSPEVGVAIRSLVALILMAAISFPQWRAATQARPAALLYIALGGGLIGAALGGVFYFGALKSAPLSQVMPIAFTSPLFGALLSVILSGEPLTPRLIVGVLLTVGGIIVLTGS